jgi:ParB/RepB/Spo0J family partition protein
MTATAVAIIQCATIPLAQVRESPFNPRKHYSEPEMEELRSSIAEHGVVQPILVRPIDGEYEIVAGHRRSRAARAAGLTEIAATVRHLSDSEARQLQLIENAQRVDLPPLDEAEAYAALIETGMTVRELAKALSRKPADIAVRLTLIHLAPAVKQALAAGVLPVDHAEAIGRIPDPTLQEHALKRVITYDQVGSKQVPVAASLAFTKRVIETEFITALNTAPFDPEDETLSPLGKCSTCPHRSGNNRDLFGDIRGKNICTNLADFHLKVKQHLAGLREQGFTVLLTAAEIKEAFPFSSTHPSEKYLDLDRACHDDPKQRTYDALLSDETKKSIVYTYYGGKLWRLFPRDLLTLALEASGHTFLQKRMERTPDPAQRAIREQQRIERTVRIEVATEFSAQVARAKVPQSEWIDFLARAVLEDRSWTIDDVLLRHGYEGKRDELQRNRLKIAKALIDKMTDAEKRSFVLDAMISGWSSPQTGEGKRALFRKAMTLFGIDVRGIDKRVRQQFAAKARARKDAAA